MPLQPTKTADRKEMSARLGAIMAVIDTLTLNLKHVQVMLNLEFSPDCDELGKYGGFVKDCRDAMAVNIKNIAPLRGSLYEIQSILSK